MTDLKELGRRAYKYGPCKTCGERHEHKGDYKKCRLGKLEQTPPRPTQRGSEITRYKNDPLRGDKRAHTIAKKLRAGRAPRKIAKDLNINLAEVEAVVERLQR